MKKTLYLLVFLFVFSSSFAQRNKNEVIYLKNGTVLKGQQTPVDDDKVVVRSGKNLWVFNYSEIDSITSKQMPGTFENESAPYFLKASVGILAGSSNNSKPTPFSFDASFNYRILPKWYLGVGAGIDFLDESYLPVFGNLEFHFRESRFTPFIGLQGGYMIPLDDEVYSGGGVYYDYMPWSSSYYYNPVPLESKGGLMVNPSFGFVSQLNPNLGLMLAFGYRYHEVNFKGDNHYQLDREYNRLSIRLGILFN